jgi:hypothetical protein
MGPEDDGDDEDDEDNEDYIPEDKGDDDMCTESDYSVHEGDFDLGEDEEGEEGEDEEGEGEEGEDEEGEDEEGEDEEDEDDEDEDEAENTGVELDGSNEKVESKHEGNATVHASLRNDTEAANTNSARPSSVPPKPGHSNAPIAESKGRLPTKDTPSPSPPPCAPSQSQPFPLPSYDPMTPLDPSIDLSSKLPKTELESSPEPDFPSVSQMLAKMHPQASQHAKPTVEKGRAQASAHVSAVYSQDITPSNVSKSLMAIRNAASSPSLPASQPKRPRPVARKVKPRALPIELQSSSTLSATPDNEDGDRSKNNGKGKRRASIESFRSCKEDISKESLRPTKRSKLEPPVAHKHEQFWILDGNTVLEVGGVLFKLHRSRLVDQSTFFAGLLNEQDVLMDDHVVVESDEHGTVYHLSNTTPTDLEALLRLDKDPM